MMNGRKASFLMKGLAGKFLLVWAFMVIVFLLVGALEAASMRRGCQRAEEWKAVGDEHFKKGHFKEALKAYKEARDLFWREGCYEACETMDKVIPFVKECFDEKRFTKNVARMVFESSGSREPYENIKGVSGGIAKGGSKGPEKIVWDYFPKLFKRTMPVLFVVGTTNFLHTDEARAQIAIYAEYMKNCKAMFVVKGYASDDGGWNNNMDLSRRRAKAVKEILEDDPNIQPERILCQWFGEDPRYFATPIDGLEEGEALKEARRDNRRVEIKRLEEGGKGK